MYGRVVVWVHASLTSETLLQRRNLQYPLGWCLCVFRNLSSQNSIENNFRSCQESNLEYAAQIWLRHPNSSNKLNCYKQLNLSNKPYKNWNLNTIDKQSPTCFGTFQGMWDWFDKLNFCIMHGTYNIKTVTSKFSHCNDTELYVLRASYNRKETCYQTLHY